MNMNEPHIQKLVQALSLTLIHSIWQGFLIAILAGLLLTFTKKARPATRYNLLAMLLFGFVAAACYTFISLFSADRIIAQSSGLTLVSGNTSAEVADLTASSLSGMNDGVSWSSLIMNFCSQNAQVIVAIWFVVFAFKSFQATAGMLYLRKIKTNNIHPLRDSWKHKFDKLAEKMKIRQVISVIESENVTVPMVIGVFKPLVIIPFGLFVNIPEAQIEAILLHELAHIKRSDYLVNLIQIFCENIFFFNPALLWLSQLIKEEREHCCDDLAIAVMENKTSFVHALVSFQEYNRKGSAFEMAFSQKRNHLLDRIKRIIYSNNKPLNAMEKLFVTISLITVAALSAAVSHVAPAAKAAPSVIAESRPGPHFVKALKTEISAVPQDTLPKKKDNKNENFQSVEVDSSDDHNSISNVNINSEGINTYRINSNGKDYDVVQIEGKTALLRIDGKEIPKEQYGDYKKEIDAVMKDIVKNHEEAEVHRKEANKMRAEADIMRKDAEKRRQETFVHQEHAALYKARAEEYRKAADVYKKESAEYRKQSEGFEKQAKVVYADAEKQRAYGEQQKLYAEAQRNRADNYREIADDERAEAETERKNYEQLQESVIKDLLESGVVSSRKDLSFKLGKSELIVNGVKQPAALHQKLKEKYMMGKEFEMVYNFSTRSGSTSTGLIYQN
ncbi:M56 family metallopeptidase [Dyadobacter psychrophilus]|uniref:Signal transducer regulating beta-lactamase production, contains metallopeptidase domain n=1 Tax=Dyadobacter psychrophilus TaxID=651661 RepID=A0A1T5DR58_9BACT|nr:M56 family metallopeptidase [Dyadobacter psychrophilus]SKB74178.1 Signal transducer regulating beta-lactamase production, contains metallopeptidase domain [Dyadobacter psychrophilus]